jgi:exopolysaccharide biosynthesis protein
VTRHPRTAVGMSRDGRRLWLVTVDGRQPDHSAGMSLLELGTLMRNLGAVQAINLDGGGSTAMVVRNRAGELVVVNKPSDAQGERAVGNALAVVREC